MCEIVVPKQLKSVAFSETVNYNCSSRYTPDAREEGAPKHLIFLVLSHDKLNLPTSLGQTNYLKLQPKTYRK